LPAPHHPQLRGPERGHYRRRDRAAAAQGPAQEPGGVMNTYLHADTIARAEALGIQARTVVEGLRVGDHKSPYRGFSVEFVQHREYVPGDDLRHIDWRVYGRAERYTIKQYEQETNFISHILLDASRSMLYGDGPQNKLEYAKLLAATLAFVIVH